jgi:hypothetical protein
MRGRHEGIEARRHEVVAKARRDQAGRTHPHSFPPRLVPTPCLRAFVPTCLLLLPLPPSPTVPNFQTNPPTVPNPPSFTPHAHRGAPSTREFLQNEAKIILSHPPEPARTARTCPNLPRARRWQNKPTAPLHVSCFHVFMFSIRQNEPTCHFGSLTFETRRPIIQGTGSGASVRVCRK